MKTKTIRHGIVGRIAQCTGCDWGLEDNGGDTGYRQINRHVARTGHTVQIETTSYSECVSQRNDAN